ncbi:MAG: dTDP-4-dehydrorhamnose 3,5-epimerase [Ignavibacteriaceae bacterium]|nr:dTDP-4-dehydrorhamnose 3,5-epimerase [Ignavibacteriaceae bacterium]
MDFKETPLKGAYLINLNKREDSRGFFARFFCKNEYSSFNLDHDIVQINNSQSKFKGTFRGIHYQLHPKAETKVIRCLKGAIYDAIVDLRKDSVTFGKWFGQELNEENRTMMYVPKGFGHGFLTLQDNTEVLYLVSEFYSPEHERGIRWNDPFFNIKWPFDPIVISDKDNSHPDFNPGSNL